jgi:hypothetical protein
MLEFKDLDLAGFGGGVEGDGREGGYDGMQAWWDLWEGDAKDLQLAGGSVVGDGAFLLFDEEFLHRWVGGYGQGVAYEKKDEAPGKAVGGYEQRQCDEREV